MKKIILSLGLMFFSTTAIAQSVIAVVDGDTIRTNGESIRIVGMDTPETYSPKCETERRKGYEAAGALNHILRTRKVRIEKTGKLDKYRRPLAIVYVGVPEKNIADIMVEQGFARVNNGESRQPWC